MSVATEVRDEVKERSKEANAEPKDVLRELMLFYHFQAKDILETIITCLEDTDDNGKPLKRGDLLALMYKKHSEAADKAIECASKLAPYRHPKLEAIEVKKDITTRFVVRAPVSLPTPEEWSKLATGDKPRMIDVTPIKNKLQNDIIEDIGYDTLEDENED